MAKAHVAHSISRKSRDRRESIGIVTSGTRHLSWLPLTLVVLSLAGLAVAPLMLQQRTSYLRDDIRVVGEPGRLLLGELRLGLARELAFAQRFTVSRDRSHLFEFQRTATRDDSLLARLNTTLHEMGPAARSSVMGVRETVDHWRQFVALTETKTPDDVLRQAVQHGVSYEALLLATVRVDSAIARAMQSRRAQIEGDESLELEIAIAFVLVGCVASAAVLVLTLRDRHLRLVLKRRAEEEASLRRLASSLSGAFTVNEVAELTVSAALNSSRIGGAYLARALDGDLVTIAGRGTCAPVAGTRARMPAWLNDGTNGDHPRIYTTEVRPSGDARNSGVDARRSGSLLVVPLRHDGSVIGTIGVASAGGRRQFRESSLRFGRALGDLAAVALHRAEALDSERRARAEAESAVRTRDAVVSIVSHDLRNPLMAILGSADLLLELTDEHGHDTERTQLATLKHAADSMNRLIRDLLDVTRLESGPLPVQQSTLNLLDVVDDVVDMFQIVVRARHMTLTRDGPHQIPTVVGDRDRLAQAFSNLIANAVKFTPDGGQIKINIELRADGVYACVRDTGPGIPPEQIPHLFDRFWQASRSDTRGLGLGLSIVKAIVEAHGGTVQVESVMNEGSAFCVRLPRADVQSLPMPNGLGATISDTTTLPTEPSSVPSIFSIVGQPLES
ncbi:MAG TPA: ATP-binding protein [Gemmatimonadaceae bacterium]|nr:ATP-binding protein [Gemmatimonadaceae bacterium]